MINNADVIVAGLGSMGSAAAEQLADRGLRVLGLEQFGPAHDRGSGHGGSRIIRKSYFEGADYVPLLQAAYRGWDRLQQQADTELLRLCGGLYLGTAEHPVITGARESAIQWGLPHEVLTAAEVRERFPTFGPADDAVAVWEAEAGYVRPEAAIGQALRIAAAKGAELRFGEKINSWRATPAGGVEVTTGVGSYGADRLVIAGGAWMPELLGDLELPLLVERRVMCWFDPGDDHQFLDGRHPIYVDGSAGPETIYGFPVIDGPGSGIKIGIHDFGSSVPAAGSPTSLTADHLDRDIDPAETEQVRERAAGVLPRLTRAATRAQACMYTMTPDEDFILGVHPDHDQLAIAAGFSGHGFKFVPVIGEILADLVQQGNTEHSIDRFAPDRFR